MGESSTASHANSVSIGNNVQSTAHSQINLGGTGDTVRISETYTLPTADGNANQVLQTNGSGALSFATVSGGAALELYAENPNSPTAPSATGNDAVAIGPNSTSSASQSIAIGSGTVASHAFAVAIGYNAQANTAFGATALTKSYASGQYSFAAAIDNNTSSYGATGPNSVAIGKNNKSTHNYSVSIGSGNQSVGAGAVTLGHDNYISGVYSTAIGYGHQIYNKTYSLAIGRHAMPRSSYAFAQGIWGNDGSAGNAQAGQYVMSASTSDATPDELAIGASGNTDNYIVLPNNGAYAFSGTVVTRQQAADGTISGAWEVKGLIRREANAGSTVLVNSAIEVLSNASSLGLALSADTTNGGLAITCTGLASTDLRWVGTIKTTEIVYA